MTDDGLVSLSERADELQIIKADDEVRQAFFYKDYHSGKLCLSYACIKHIALEMAYRKEPLQVVDYEVHLEKYNEADEEKWYWAATVTMLNKATGMKTLGASSSPYLARNKKVRNNEGQWVESPEPRKFNEFGRTVTLSKADRNAIRKHIPETVLQKMLRDATGENTEVLGVDDVPAGTRRASPDMFSKPKEPQPKEKTAAPAAEEAPQSGDGPVTERQMRILTATWHGGYDGPMPKTKYEAQPIIKKIMDDYNAEKAAK